MRLKKTLLYIIYLSATLLYAQQTTLQKQMAEIMKNFKTAALNGDNKKATALSEYPASVFIIGSGYKTTVRVNNGELIVCNEGSVSRQLSGGIKNGVNTIELEIIKQPAKMDMYPSIEVKYIDKTKQEKTAFSADEKAMKTGKWSETFRVQ